MSAKLIYAGIADLNRYIGGYPPRYSGEAQRREIYVNWVYLLNNALSLTDGDTKLEERLYLIADLYRQGHNLDVEGAGNEANKAIKKCLSIYPMSEKCNLTAVYFYLSVVPTQDALAAAERSLNNLSAFYWPIKDSEVQAGFVFFYLYKHELDKAKQQMAAYIEQFPDDPRTEMFEKLRADINNNIRYKINIWY